MTDVDSGALASRFIACTLTREEWTHRAHLIVGYWHVHHYGVETALSHLRTRIRRLNERHGTANSSTGGYHETVTRAYVTLHAFLDRCSPDMMLDARVTLLLSSPLAAKDVLLTFYSRERLFSTTARAQWVAPDVAPLHFAPMLDDPSCVHTMVALVRSQDSTPIRIRQAAAADVATVSSILTEAADWLTERGMRMWRANELLPEQIAQDVADGLFSVAEHGGEPVGTMKFQLTDTEFWPDVPEGESAFVHRLAVRRRFAGGAVSSALLHWAVMRATSLGRRYLRLDCEASRERLRSIYERFGFQHHSDRQVGPYFVARYELALSDGHA